MPPSPRAPRRPGSRPCIGPHISAHAIGGPACRISRRRRAMPGTRRARARCRRAPAAPRRSARTRPRWLRRRADRRMRSRARARRRDRRAPAAASRARRNRRPPRRRCRQTAPTTEELEERLMRGSFEHVDASPAASTAASKLLSAMIAPASVNAAACAALSCGSPSVPQTCPISASVRPFARASRCAARSAAARSLAGLACAPKPSTTSNRIAAVSGSAACVRIAALRSEGSIIGCGRPRVYSSSPRSMNACPETAPSMTAAPFTGAFDEHASPRARNTSCAS